ncbi:hypothetical protein ScPMuIL_012819 [Solemya velum]
MDVHGPNTESHIKHASVKFEDHRTRPVFSMSTSELTMKTMIILAVVLSLAECLEGRRVDDCSECDANASCIGKMVLHFCKCNAGYSGDGITCTAGENNSDNYSSDSTDDQSTESTDDQSTGITDDQSSDSTDDQSKGNADDQSTGNTDDQSKGSTNDQSAGSTDAGSTSD